MSLIIGIDPGSRLTGYGIIQKEGQKLIFVDAGTIRTEAADMPERLKRIFAGIDRIVKFHGPTEAAVEQVFMAQNPDSALKLGKHVVLLLLHWSTLTYKLQNTPHVRLNSRWSVMALRTKNKYK